MIKIYSYARSNFKFISEISILQNFVKIAKLWITLDDFAKHCYLLPICPKSQHFTKFSNVYQSLAVFGSKNISTRATFGIAAPEPIYNAFLSVLSVGKECNSA